MNLFKKVVASVSLAAVVISTTATGVSAYNNEDVTAANGLAAAKVINDHSNNPIKYELDRTVLRQETAKIAVNLDENLSPKTTCDNEFADITATKPNNWVCYYAEALRDAGKVSANTNFEPERNVTKSEAVKMMLDAAGCKDFYSDVNKWQSQTVAFASENGIAPSFTDYNTPATRAFVFTVAYNAMNKCPITEEVECDSTLAALGVCELEDNNTEETTSNENKQEETTSNNNTTTNSEAVVKLSAQSPVDGSVAAGAPRTPFVAFDLIAGNEDVVLNKVSLKYIGLSDAKHLTDLAVYLDNDKVTKGTDKTFDSDNERDLYFDKDVVIKAGETKTLFVTATATGWVANEVHQIEVTKVESKDGEIAGTPIIGAKLTPVEVTNRGALEAKDDTASEEVNVGEEVKLAGFNLDETSDKEDVVVKSITFTVDGSVDTDDLADLSLLADGKEIAKDLTVNSDDEIVASIDYTIPKDENVDFELKGVVTGSVGNTIDVNIEDANDIYAVGASTNVSVPVTLESNFDTSDTRTIQGADINVSFDKSDIDEVKPDTDDVLVGTLKISTDSADYEVKKLNVKVTSTNTWVLNAIKDLKVDGESYDATTVTNANDVTFVFKDIVLKKGSQELPIKFDLEDDVNLNGTDLTFNVKFAEIKDTDENKTYTDGGTLDINDILSSNSFDNKTITVETASFTMTAVEVNPRDLVLANGIETVAYKAKVNVGDSDSVKIKDIKFIKDATTSLSNGADLKDIIDSATLNIGGKTFDGDVNANDIRFDSMNAVIEAWSDNVEVLLTVTLKDNDKIQDGDKLVLKVDTTSLDLKDSSNDDVKVLDLAHANDHLAVTNLLDHGKFVIRIKNDPDTDDNLKNTVLAGTDNVTLAEIELESKYEDTKVKEINFDFGYGTDFSNTITNVKIVDVDNGQTLVDGGVVTYSSWVTTVKFKNDFIVPDAADLIKAEVVADLNPITGKGDATSAKSGTLKLQKIRADKEDIKWVQSNDELITDNNWNPIDLVVTGTGEDVTIVPTILRFAVTQSLSDGSAKVKITADSGNNTVGDSNEKPYAYIETLTFTELGNTTESDAYKLYKDGEATNIITAGVSNHKVVFTLTGTTVDNSFDTDATYVIVPKGTTDTTYSLVLSGDVAKYDVKDSAGTQELANDLTTHLDSDINVGSKSY